MKAENLYPVILFLVAIFLTNQIFRDGFLICKDNPFHLARLEFLINNLLANGKLEGWAELNSAGFPIFLYDYRLGYWATALISTLLDVAIAFKILIFASYFGPVLISFIVLRRLLSENIAFVISILLLFQIDFLASPLEGLWGQYFSLPLLIMFFYFFNKILDKKIKFQNFVALGILLSLIVFAHQFTAIYTLIIALVGLIFYIWKRKLHIGKVFIGLGITALVASLLTSFYIYPILETSDWLRSLGTGIGGTQFGAILKIFGHMFLPHMRLDEIKSSVGWNLESFDFEEIINNFPLLINFSLQNISELIFSLLFIFGIISLLKARDEFRTFLVLSLIATLILISGVIFSISPNLPLLSNISGSRFIVYARLIMIFLAAYGLSYLIKKMNHIHIFKKLKLSHEDIYLIFVSLFVILFISFLNIANFVCTDTSKTVPEIKNVEKLWGWVKNNVNGKETRILYQDTFSNYETRDLGFSHILSLSYNYTNVPQIGAWTCGDPYILNISCTSYGNLFNSSSVKITENEIIYWLENLNVKYIVAVDKSLQNKLESFANLEKVAVFGNFSIFSLKNYSPSWVMLSGRSVGVNLTEFDNGNIRFQLRVNDTSDIIVKTQYHPYWSGFINGVEVSIAENELHMIKLKPPIVGDLDIKLTYN